MILEIISINCQTHFFINYISLFFITIFTTSVVIWLLSKQSIVYVRVHALCGVVLWVLTNNIVLWFLSPKTPMLHLSFLFPSLLPNSSTKLLARPDLFKHCSFAFPECHMVDSIHLFRLWELLSLSDISLKASVSFKAQ